MSFQDRRQAIMSQIGSGIAVVPTSPVRQRNSDVEYPFRPDSDFYYLTRFSEPESVAVFAPGHDDGEYLLFCREKDPDKELWNGRRAGVEGAVSEFGADAAHPISKLGEMMPQLLSGRDSIHYPIGRNPDFDAQLIGWLNQVRSKVRLGVRAPTQIVDLGDALKQMRIRKDESEIGLMRRAGQIAAEAHCSAMRMCRPGLAEFEIQSEVERCFRNAGCEPAYPSIVASGSNACILHYMDNRDPLRDGDLLLIDAGAELDCYASDITRTFPVNGRFSTVHKEVYAIVLEAQLNAIACAVPGKRHADVHDASVAAIVDGLRHLGLLSGSADEIIEQEAFKKFYMHKVGHWIGLDVHDVGDYVVDGESMPLEKGLCMTVEPGIYISPADDVPLHFHGIGIRIEDDIVITDAGNEVLTDAVPKEPDAIESLMGGA